MCHANSCNCAKMLVSFVGDKKCLNSELWHACAGPLVSLPHVGSRVVYFPQGHSEQVSEITLFNYSLAVEM
jgi:hypothetical protein